MEESRIISNLSNERLDKFLLNKIDLNRSQIKKNIESGNIKVNNEIVKSGFNLSIGDEITIALPEKEILKAQYIKFNILYEDEYIAIISKPQDLVVHPGSGNFNNTLVSGLLYKFDKLAKGSDKNRPGIVHRLDKDTSGLMIIAKTNESYYKLVNMFKNSEIKKNYYAIVHGKVNEYGFIDEPIGRNIHNRKKMSVTNINSKNAITKFKRILYFDNFSFVNINLLTGRTHQIRVHFSYINHPVLGDLVYGNKNKYKINKQMLHAYKLEFNHPITNKYLIFEDDIPERFNNFFKKFNIKY